MTGDGILIASFTLFVLVNADVITLLSLCTKKLQEIS